MVELLVSISKYDVILPKSIEETNAEIDAVVDQVALSLTPDSDDTRKLSVNTSEDDITGIALIEAYPQEVNVVETSESSSDSDVVVPCLQEDSSFPAVAVQTMSNVSEQDEGVDAASFAEEQHVSLKPHWNCFGN